MEAPPLLMKANEGCSSDLLSSLHPSLTGSWVNLDHRQTSNADTSLCVSVCVSLQNQGGFLIKKTTEFPPTPTEFKKQSKEKPNVNVDCRQCEELQKCYKEQEQIRNQFVLINITSNSCNVLKVSSGSVGSRSQTSFPSDSLSMS